MLAYEQPLLDVFSVSLIRPIVKVYKINELLHHLLYPKIYKKKHANYIDAADEQKQ